MNLNRLSFRPTGPLLGRTLRAVAPTVALLGMVACDSTGSMGTGDLGSGPDMVAATRFGLVRITSTTSMSGAQTVSSSSATAVFLDTSQGGGACQRRSVGDCQLYACSNPGFALPTAGNIVIGGGSQPITLMARTDGSYSEYGNSNSAIFTQGQKLTVEAAGGTVPAFNADVTPPQSAFNLTNPDGTRIDPLLVTLSRRADYMLTWSPLLVGPRVHVELNQGIDSNKGLYLECDFDGTKGQGTMPASLLMSFNVSSGNFNLGELLVGPSANSTAAPGGWAVTVVGTAGGRKGIVTVTDN